MDKQTIELLNDLYKRQKQADISNNFAELTKINKQIFAINQEEGKAKRKQQAIDREVKLARKIEQKMKSDDLTR